MSFKASLFFALFVMLAGPRTATADDLATQIITRGEDIMRGHSAQALMTMKIQRPEYTRTLQIRAWTNGASHALVEILNPAKEEGVSSLRLKDQMWNYFPNSDQTVRVPPSLMLQSWMGSDFTNDDLMKASSLARDYTHRMLGKENRRGSLVYAIELIPKKNAAVVWGKVLHYARVHDSLPVEQRFFDEEGKLVRTVRYGRFRKMDDRVVPTLSQVNVAEDPHHFTIIEYQKVLYDRKISADIFNTDSIRRNSQQGRMLASQWFRHHMPGYQAPAILTASRKPRVIRRRMTRNTAATPQG